MNSTYVTYISWEVSQHYIMFISQMFITFMESISSELPLDHH